MMMLLQVLGILYLFMVGLKELFYKLILQYEISLEYTFLMNSNDYETKISEKLEHDLIIIIQDLFLSHSILIISLLFMYATYKCYNCNSFTRHSL